MFLFRGRVGGYRGVLGKRVWAFRPWKFILDSGCIRAGWFSGEIGKTWCCKNDQRQKGFWGQDSTMAPRLMVLVGAVVPEEFPSRFTALYSQEILQG